LSSTTALVSALGASATGALLPPAAGAGPAD